MQRITVTLDDDLMEQIDRLIAEKGYQNRSEAIRDLARAGLKADALTPESTAPAMGVLSYVYDHAARDLSKRITSAFHDHHDLAISSLHVHLDHDSCLEVAILRGPASTLQRFSEGVITERAVRHGALALIPISGKQAAHAQAHAAGHRHPHDGS